ncbi:LEAF RUST 10 DISEASE-RESISTANCE LOCUS RECEPTOR-LIKE PROTEIN KINASE-like 1.5 [Phoenix dactylifera]|uniref:LEAF RUST 10 DISEASE-RESISTANCE LOCUS RECEPTOR-LIKE PROTEIN KINASE-like 1.5 n=1 Tax=Phoenix dactylifera TaxID=42345 RepID=A0A8B7D149_PHODC|nr:LEAF RUST 10 DISEASE-RESISTANCE LOCUS RECEPTOR-LIKE PROTEIN KINASE-like 1.5 [Phoenix dactylifera]
MPPPPFPLPLLLAIAALLSAAVEGSHRACSPPPHAGRTPQPSCPPFRSPPSSFPFSSSAGCGHPSFQINCSSPHSLISIHSAPFLVLDHQPNSLLLSPSLPHSSSSACPSLPTAPINLSGSPFRLSLDTCSHLLSLRPCPLAASANSSCRLSKWQRLLLSKPRLLLNSCFHATLHRAAAAPCQHDVHASIAAFLRSGIEVEWDSTSDPYFSNCSSCQRATGGVCGFNDSSSSKDFLCFPSAEHLGRQPTGGPTHRLLILITTLFAVTCLLVVVLSLWAAAFLRRRRDDPCGAAGDPMTAFLRRHHLHPPVYTYDHLHAATGGFDPRRKIGDGGFGAVYLAQLGDGRIAAVKRLHSHHPSASTKSFCNEILILSSLRHPNLVRLHGYCCDPRGLLLVYDYVPNGTVADHLHGSRSAYSRAALTWAVRVDIALQTAAALEYLHFSLKPPVVHRDITSANIFVERDMRVKVGDFGLSRLLSLPEDSSSGSSEYVCCTGPQGTPGYLDPDYHRSFRLTEKSDVYSFGVVLLELVTGMKAVDLGRDRREVTLADLAVAKIQVGALHQVVDPVLLRQGKEAMATVEAVAELAFRCVAGDKDDRPDARELVEELKRIRSRMHDARS